jgi:hypothetical protein
MVSGIVSELRIGSTSFDLGFSSSEAKFAGSAAILAAASGNAINATALSGSSYGADVNMEEFVCKVDDFVVFGMFHKVGFAEGDAVDFVVQDDEKGLKVAAARDSSSRYIWVEPYKTRGNTAQFRHDLIWGITLTVGPSLSAGAYLLTVFTSENALFLSSSVGLVVFCIAAVINYLVRRRFFAGSYDATKIFKTLGFSDPARVDLPKGSSAAEQQWAKRSGRSVPPVVPWRYRY